MLMCGSVHKRAKMNSKTNEAVGSIPARVVPAPFNINQITNAGSNSTKSLNAVKIIISLD